MHRRGVVIVIPARDEADRIANCLQHLAAVVVDDRVDALNIVVLANNCADDTATRTAECAAGCAMPISVETVRLPPERANAGWARRLAFDAGLRFVRDPHDVLLCTDADTVVARDWLVKTLDHLDAGFDAVAGFARLDPKELRKLDPAYRRRLASIRRYEDAFNYLKAMTPSAEPWPRHFYEGGASIAITRKLYREIGGAPTPSVGEDKALFEAVRAKGGRIRHAKDVRVLTSCRFDGRAKDGAADTLAKWGAQDIHDSLWGVNAIDAAFFSGVSNDKPLTLDRLSAETQKARALVRTARSRRGLIEAI